MHERSWPTPQSVVSPLINMRVMCMWHHQPYLCHSPYSTSTHKCHTTSRNFKKKKAAHTNFVINAHRKWDSSGRRQLIHLCPFFNTSEPSLKLPMTGSCSFPYLLQPRMRWWWWWWWWWVGVCGGDWGEWLMWSSPPALQTAHYWADRGRERERQRAKRRRERERQREGERETLRGNDKGREKEREREDEERSSIQLIKVEDSGISLRRRFLSSTPPSPLPVSLLSSHPVHSLHILHGRWPGREH